jgi:hypothetical protein
VWGPLLGDLGHEGSVADSNDPTMDARRPRRVTTDRRDAPALAPAGRDRPLSPRPADVDRAPRLTRPLSTATQNSPPAVSENSPSPSSLRGLGGADEANLELVFEAVGVAPRMLMVIAWWRIRSRTAVAMTRSPKTSPQAPKLW